MWPNIKVKILIGKINKHFFYPIINIWFQLWPKLRWRFTGRCWPLSALTQMKKTHFSRGAFLQNMTNTLLTSFFLFLTSSFLFPTSGFLCLTWSFLFLTSFFCFSHQDFCFLHQVGWAWQIETAISETGKKRNGEFLIKQLCH